MKTTDHDVGRSMRDRLANTRNKIPAQYVSKKQELEYLSDKQEIEESVRMEGYDMSFGKKKRPRFEAKQPMAGHSEFWIG